jgi:hypothetical protein
VGDSAFARYRGLIIQNSTRYLGLAPQALCCRPLRGLDVRTFADWTLEVLGLDVRAFADWTFGVRGLDARGSRTGRSGFADWTFGDSRDWTLEVRGLKDCKNCELTLIYAHTVNLSPIIFICNP